MHYGVAIFPTAYSISMTDLGPALEDRGFESLWLAEHSHIPASRESPWPGGDELPQMYYDTLDPFVALASAAAVTTHLKLATGIALVAQRDAIHTAKQAASLDVISGGRFLMGVGAGWNVEEMVDHGTDPDRRFGRMRESVEAARALWTNDVAEYRGEQISFGPTFQNPKPIQPGGPPIHVGGVFPGAMQRAVRYGDGWIPIGGRGDSGFADQARAFDEACAAAGRNRDELELSVYYAPANADSIADLAAVGVDRLIFGLPSADSDTVLPLLDGFARLMA